MPGYSLRFRSIFAFVLIALPPALLLNGIYGSFLFCFSIPFLWQVCYRGQPFSSLGLRRLLAAPIIWGLVTGVALGLLSGKVLGLLGLTGYSLDNFYNLQPALGIYQLKFPLANELGFRLLAMSNSRAGLLVYFSFLILIVGLGEEIFWRGFIQRKIAGRIRAPAAIWVSALLFALMHFYLLLFLPVNRGIAFLALIGIAGATWGYLYEKTGNIWTAAVSHGIAAAIIWKYYFFA